MSYNMLNYLCLIVKPNSKSLTSSIIDHSKDILASCHDSIIEEKWLEINESYEILLKSNNTNELNILLQSKMPKYVDCLLVPKKNRKMKLLVADMDSTIIREETLDEIARSLGIHDKISKITNLAMDGKINFIDSLNERIAALKGVKSTDLKNVLEKKLTINSGAETLIKTMRENQCKTALVTGGFSFFAKPIGDMLGFDYVISNTLEIVDECLTGKLLRPIIDGEAKKNSLIKIAEKNNIGINQTIAVGDGENDIQMIETAGVGVGFKAKSGLQKKTTTNIINGDLTSILYIQGYKKSEFI
ncbi:MAG: phosphoserine phosphatase SerB [Rhodospirillaceae bacterium]|nr:phosphoserine phosphatase SerB [Rhodospirillaceae bacterium]